jgi:membrane protease subunit HflC
MSAYSQALNDSGTTMVLSPNSDFFRYFQDPSGSSRRPAAGNTTQ